MCGTVVKKFLNKTHELYLKKVKEFALVVRCLYIFIWCIPEYIPYSNPTAKQFYFLILHGFRVPTILAHSPFTSFSTHQILVPTLGQLVNLKCMRLLTNERPKNQLVGAIYAVYRGLVIVQTRSIQYNLSLLYLSIDPPARFSNR